MSLENIHLFIKQTFHIQLPSHLFKTKINGSIINTVDNKYQPYLNLQKNRKECKIPL